MENNSNKRGRGRPSGSPNKNTTLNRLKNNRDLVKKEVAKKAGLFVVKQMNKIEELYENLTPSAQAKLLIELMKFSTTTYAEEMKLKHIEKENKSKSISKIEISYEAPVALPAPAPEEIIEIQDAQDDIVDEDEGINNEDENEPF